MKTINRISAATSQKAVLAIVSEAKKYDIAPKNLQRVVRAGQARVSQLKAIAAAKRAK